MMTWLISLLIISSYERSSSACLYRTKLPTQKDGVNYRDENEQRRVSLSVQKYRGDPQGSTLLSRACETYMMAEAAIEQLEDPMTEESLRYRA